MNSNIKTSDIALFKISNNTPYVLLTIREDNLIEGGKVCMPGGHIEKYESPLDGAVRELKEETGVDLNQCKNILHLVKYNTPNETKYRNCYGTTYAGILPKSSKYFYNCQLTSCENEVKEVRWYGIDQIPYNNMAFDHDEVIKYIIDKIQLKYWS
jgi:8-oxo-dGTP pyrophosphatase MutT (NUDIX family)